MMSLDSVINELEVYYKIASQYKIVELQGDNFVHFRTEIDKNKKDYEFIRFKKITTELPKEYTEPLKIYFIKKELNK
jgi:hypothetical protein